MREIKFRAWYKPTKTMHKVGQVTLEKGTWNYEPDNKEYVGVCVPYQPSFILMQYIGLKDKNGKEIYEGDIFTLGDRRILYIVEWSDTAFRGRQNGNSSAVGLEYWQSNIEVIGNIYENKDLLKERR